MRRRQILSAKQKAPEKKQVDLREQYREKFGHYPKGRMKPETMKERINAV